MDSMGWFFLIFFIICCAVPLAAGADSSRSSYDRQGRGLSLEEFCFVVLIAALIAACGIALYEHYLDIKLWIWRVWDYHGLQILRTVLGGLAAIAIAWLGITVVRFWLNSRFVHELIRRLHRRDVAVAISFEAFVASIALVAPALQLDVSAKVTLYMIALAVQMTFHDEVVESFCRAVAFAQKRAREHHALQRASAPR
jgi:hypothetical protein